MDYSNKSIRRQDRLLEEENAIRLLQEGEFGILSMQAEEGGGYGIPVNYVWDGRNSLYIHCAPEGKKLRCINACNKVSFCIVGAVHLIPNQFSTEYESIILSCAAHTGLSETERMKALELILDRFSPNDKAVGLKYTEKSFHRTEIIRLDIEQWSGKCKHIRTGTE